MDDKINKLLIVVGVLIVIGICLIFFLPNDSKSNNDQKYVIVEQTAFSLGVGEEEYIRVNANTDYYFKSSDSSIVSVDKSGRIKALSSGTATIEVASSDGRKKTLVNVSVTEKTSLKVTGIQVDSSNESKKYVKSDDDLVITINFNDYLNEKPKVLINNEEMDYTYSKNQKKIVILKNIGDEKEIVLKVYNDTLIYEKLLVKVDNQEPKCSLKEENGYIVISGTDNYDVVAYAISKNSNYTYGKEQKVKTDGYGTWYGYVKDDAGNVGKCSITLKKPEVKIDPSSITLVGDSRFDMLCGYSWYKSDGGTCIAESGMGYNWLISTAIPKVNRLNISKKKYIATNLGVNGLSENSVEKYITKYKELADGDWKDSMIFLVSVNPTTGSYDYMNSNIDSFNKRLKEAFSGYKNVTYCDTNSYLKKVGFGSNDGLHYTQDSSKVIYEQIKKCIYDYYN